MDKSVRAGANVVKKKAKENAPVISGLLRNSIYVRKTPKSKKKAQSAFDVMYRRSDYTQQAMKESRYWGKLGGKVTKSESKSFKPYFLSVEFGDARRSAQAPVSRAARSEHNRSVQAMRTTLLKFIDKQEKKA